MNDEALMRQALAALESAHEDSVELLAERRLAWAGYHEWKLAILEAAVSRQSEAIAALRDRLRASGWETHSVSGASVPVGQPAGEQTGPVAEAPTRVTSGYFRIVDPTAPAGLEWE